MRTLAIGLISASLAVVSAAGPPTAGYPPSALVEGVTFDFPTLVELAPGSDNWVITWGQDDHQYTSWGDGGGFGGTNDLGRVSLGVGRIEGTKESYQGFNVWGGFEPENPATFSGKSYGILALGPTLFLWRSGSGSGASAFDFQRLYRSDDSGANWIDTGIEFEPADFPGSDGPFTLTFLQFGRAYAGARDQYIYTYGPENQGDGWEVQIPGEISLLRVAAAEVEDPAAWEFFTGLDAQGLPLWSGDPGARSPVFSDPVNGVMRTSVGYNAGLGRYFLITQQVSRFQSGGGHIGIYEAPEPWGPWATVLFADPWALGLQNGSKTVYWNFSNKWLSPDGRDFVLVYTGDGADNWGTLEGSFRLREIFADGFETGDTSGWSASVP